MALHPQAKWPDTISGGQLAAMGLHLQPGATAPAAAPAAQQQLTSAPSLDIRHRQLPPAVPVHSDEAQQVGESLALQLQDLHLLRKACCCFNIQ